MQQNTSRDIFLSHRTIDKEFVRKLSSDIEQELFHNQKLLTWIDEAEIRPGQSIVSAINQGLESSRFIALVLSPDYFTSESGWTDAEWHSALFSDPDNRGGKIIPILIEDCPKIPYLLRHLKLIDFRGNRYSRGLDELFLVLKEQPSPRPTYHRGQMVSRGSIDRATLTAERAIIEADPDVLNENLHCNLLPVVSLPQFVYEATINEKLIKSSAKKDRILPTKNELKEILKQIQQEARAEKVFMPAFRCTEDKIYTFHDLESPGGVFQHVIDEKSIVQIQTKDMLIDEDSRNIVTGLLNMALSRHMFKRGLLVDDEKKNRYFFPLEDGKERVIEWKPFKNKTTRTVAKSYKRNDEVFCWLHQGAYLKMFFLANNYYLQILPTWVVTEDGVKIKGGTKVSSIVNRWTSGERNLALVYYIRFWTYIIRSSDGAMGIRAGDQYIQLNPRSAFIQLPFGIANDFKNLISNLDEEAETITSTENAIVDYAVEKELEEEDDGDVIEDLNELLDDDTHE